MPQTFQDAIKESSEVLDSIKSGRAKLEGALEDFRQLLSTEESARGFFVALLTGDYQFAERPQPALVQAISDAGAVAMIVLAKNLVMSTNMSLVHERNGDKSAADGSRTVARRAGAIIKAMDDESMQQHLRWMQCALSIALGSRGTCKSGGSDTTTGDEVEPQVTKYVEFLKRWKYDSEQLSKSKQVIEDLV